MRFVYEVLSKSSPDTAIRVQSDSTIPELLAAARQTGFVLFSSYATRVDDIVSIILAVDAVPPDAEPARFIGEDGK